MTQHSVNETLLQRNQLSPNGTQSLQVSGMSNNIMGHQVVQEYKEQNQNQVKENKEKKDKTQSKSKDKKKSKAKKTQHRCILCRTIGKKSQMKKCSVCKHYSHLSCLEQEQFSQKTQYVCQKCLNTQQFQKNKAEIKQKKRQQKNQLKKTDKKKQEKQKKKQQLLILFQKFKNKYPYYIVEEKQIKFPIEDKLFSIYHQLFSVPDLKLNTISHPTIPSKYLGDFLFIQNFMVTYGKDLEGNYNWSGSKSKIYKIMNCQGSDRVFQTLLGAIIKIYLNDIFFKNKIQNIKILNENAFFILLGLLNEAGLLTSNYLSMTSRQVLRQLSIVPSMRNSFNNFQFPNQLNFQTKTELIINLVNGFSEVDRFHDMVSKKSQRISELTKQKTDCVAKLKSNQVQALINKQKLKQMTEKENKDDKSPETKGKNKSISKNQKKSEQLAITGQISQRIIKDIRFRIQNITKQIPYVISQVIYLGKDRNQSHYFFYFREPNRIYIRLKDYTTDQSQNYKYVETKQNIWQLVKCLNLKGIHQRKLHDSINNLIKEQVLRNVTEDEIIKQGQQQFLLPAGECVLIFDENLLRGIIIKDVLEIQESFSKYLAIKSYQWSSETKRRQFRFGFPLIETKQALKQQIKALHENFLFVEVMKKQSKKLESDSNSGVEPFNSKEKIQTMKKKPIRMWGINSEKTKKYWSDYLQSTVNFTGLWICVNIFKSYMERYIEKKLEIIREEQRKLNMKNLKNLKKMKELQQSQISKEDKTQIKSKGRSKSKKIGRKQIPPQNNVMKTRRSHVVSKIKDGNESSQSKQDAQDEQYKGDDSS